jgi:hypothetical protein
MSWVTLLTTLLKLVLELVRWLERRQAIRAAEAIQLEALLERANVIASNANLGRDSVDPSDDSILSDPNNRANQRTAESEERRSSDPPSGV